jgi:hypothetical protein
MKFRILVTLAFLISTYNTWGQDSVKIRGQLFNSRDLPSKTKIDLPLYIIKVDGKTCQVPASRRFSNSRQVTQAFKELNSDLVQTIDLLKDKNATDRYGTLGKYGVIIINMKEGTFDSLPRKLKRGCK